MRCCDGLPQQECAHTSVLSRRPAHRAVEHLDHQIRRDHLVLNLADRDQVDLRLLDLDHRAAGVGELVILLVEGVGDRQHALGHALVMAVLRSEGDDLGRDRAELDRLLGEPLRRLPQHGVLQVAAPDRADDRRHHPRFQVVVQDVAARKPQPAAAGRSWARIGMLVAAHVVRRIAGPALPADVVVEPAVTVSHDVEPGKLLVAQIAGQRVDVLLAVAAADHRIEEHAGAEILRVPARPRQRTGDRRRQHDVLGAPIHLRYLPECETRFRFLTGRWYSLPAQRKQQKVAAAAAAAAHACAQSGWAIAPMGDRR